VSLPGGNDDEHFYSNFEPTTTVLRLDRDGKPSAPT
jgi:hypothetical protein